MFFKKVSLQNLYDDTEKGKKLKLIRSYDKRYDMIYIDDWV